MPAVVQIYLNYGTIYEYQTYLTYLVFGLFKCGMGGIFCTYQKYDESVNTDILTLALAKHFGKHSFKMGQPWPIFHLFSVFSSNYYYNFTTN